MIFVQYLQDSGVNELLAGRFTFEACRRSGREALVAT